MGHCAVTDGVLQGDGYMTLSCYLIEGERAVGTIERAPITARRRLGRAWAIYRKQRWLNTHVKRPSSRRPGSRPRIAGRQRLGPFRKKVSLLPSTDSGGLTLPLTGRLQCRGRSSG